jgi:hypothetical protein
MFAVVFQSLKSPTSATFFTPVVASAGNSKVTLHVQPFFGYALYNAIPIMPPGVYYAFII